MHDFTSWWSTTWPTRPTARPSCSTIWGYDARACYSGTAALVSARERRPDVVLLDLGMPLMDGFRFTTLFHSLPGCEEVPVVAISGHSSPAYFSRARAVGIRHFLVKPADPDRLKELLTWEFEPAASRLPIGQHRLR